MRLGISLKNTVIEAATNEMPTVKIKRMMKLTGRMRRADVIGAPIATAIMKRAVMLNSESINVLIEVDAINICLGIYIFFIRPSFATRIPAHDVTQIENIVHGTRPEYKNTANDFNGIRMMVAKTIAITVIVISGFTSVQNIPRRVL